MAALNKYWRAVSVDEYLHKMDVPATENAITVAGFPKDIVEWVWEEEPRPGLVWRT